MYAHQPLEAYSLNTASFSHSASLVFGLGSLTGPTGYIAVCSERIGLTRTIINNCDGRYWRRRGYPAAAELRARKTFLFPSDRPGCRAVEKGGEGAGQKDSGGGGEG